MAPSGSRWLALVLAGACGRSAPAPAPEVVAGETWLRGGPDARFATVARHLRGFDVAMLETGARYAELGWAIQDRNWAYASYQVDKIETTVALALERRPRRASSAAMLAPALAGVRAAIARAEPEPAAEAFAALTAACNGCHVAEQVGFIPIAPPAQRLAPVTAPPSTPEPTP
jgi:hypothetical protein